MSEAPYWPDVGDIVWTDFNPTLGREQAGRRPALVVSPETFSRNSGFVIVCPITSKIRPSPTSAVLPDDSPIRGEILLANIRSLDLHARVVRFAGYKVSARVATEAREKLGALIAI